MARPFGFQGVLAGILLVVLLVGHSGSQSTKPAICTIQGDILLCKNGLLPILKTVTNRTSFTSITVRELTNVILNTSSFDGISTGTIIISLNNQLTTLGRGLFSGLPSVSSITIHIYGNNQLTTLGRGLFLGLPKAHFISIYRNNQLTTLVRGLFFGLEANNIGIYDNNMLRTIEAEAFRNVSARFLYIQNNPQLTDLSADIFLGATFRTLGIYANDALRTLPSDVFRGLKLSYGVIFRNHKINMYTSTCALFMANLQGLRFFGITLPVQPAGCPTANTVCDNDDPNLQRLVCRCTAGQSRISSTICGPRQTCMLPSDGPGCQPTQFCNSSAPSSPTQCRCPVGSVMTGADSPCSRQNITLVQERAWSIEVQIPGISNNTNGTLTVTNSNNPTTPQAFAVTAERFLLSGVKPCSWYHFAMQATVYVSLNVTIVPNTPLVLSTSSYTASFEFKPEEECNPGDQNRSRYNITVQGGPVGKTFEVDVSNNNSVHNVTGLRPCTRYQLSVTNLPYAPVNFMTAVPNTPSLLSTSSYTASFEFKPEVACNPGDQNRSRYNITVQGGPMGKTFDVDVSNNNFVHNVTGLRPCTRYQLSVPNLPYASVNFITPGQVTVLQTSALSAQLGNIPTAACIPNNDQNRSRYNITVQGGPLTKTFEVDVSNNSSVHNVTGLRPCTRYHLSVPSLPYVSVNFTTTAPSTPAVIQASLLSLSFQFKPEQECNPSGQDTSEYTFTLRGQPLPNTFRTNVALEQSGSLSNNFTVDVSNNNFLHTVSDLLACTEYELSADGLPYPPVNFTTNQPLRLVEKSVITSSRVELTCIITGCLLQDIQWTLPHGRNLNSSSSFLNITHQRNSTTRISMLSFFVGNYTMAGDYQCSANSSKELISTSFNVSESRLVPNLESITEVWYLMIDETAGLACSFSGYLDGPVTWMFEGTQLAASFAQDTVHGHVTNSTSPLMLLTTAQEGDYICKASNRFGSVRGVVTVGVNRGNLHSSARSIVTNNRVEFVCFFNESILQDVFWTLPIGGSLTRSALDVTITQQRNSDSARSTLSFPVGTGTFLGKYQCLGRSHFRTESEVFNLRRGQLVPLLESHTKLVVTEVGQTAVLSCSISGYIPNGITWSRRSQPIQTGPIQSTVRNGTTYSTYTLAITDVKQAGPYSCSASNRFGSLTETVLLSIDDVPPVLVQTPSVSFPALPTGEEVRQATARDELTNISCTFSGFLNAQITWARVDGMPVTGIVYQMQSGRETTSVLSIVVSGSQQAGFYECTAKDAKSTTSHTILLKEPPKTEGASSSDAGVIAGSIVGSALFIMVVFAAGYWYLRANHAKRPNSTTGHFALSQTRIADSMLKAQEEGKGSKGKMEESSSPQSSGAAPEKSKAEDTADTLDVRSQQVDELKDAVGTV